jgi:hypothetical protein
LSRADPDIFINCHEEANMMIANRMSEFLLHALRGASAVAMLAFAQPALALDCDVNGDGSINTLDINLVTQARNTPASVNDPRDPNHDGSITAADARVCVTRCSLPRCAIGPVAASMQLSLPQAVVGAGGTLVVTPSVLDSAGKTITPTPAVSYQVVPDATTSGAMPIVNGGNIELPADTRGSFTITGTVNGTAVTAQARFTVLQNTTSSSTADLLVVQSAAQSSVVNNLATLTQAVQNNDMVAVASAHAALVAASSTVDVNALSLTSVYAPDTGFVPTAGQLASRGYPQTAADIQFGTLTGQIRSKIQQITQLLNQPTGNDANDTATLGQYAADLQTLLTQLQQTTNRPTPYGLSNKSSDVNNLMTGDLPKVLKALAGRVDAELRQAGLIARAGNAGTLYGQLDANAAPVPLVSGSTSPAAMYATAKPVFLLTGLLGYGGNIGSLIQKIYGDYLDQVQKMYILLAAQGLLNNILGQTVGEIGLVTGASFSFHIYHASNSVIDVAGMSGADAQNADVFLIGGAAVNAVSDLISQLGSVSQIQSIQDLNDFYQGMLDAIQGAGQAYEDAHQQPDYYYFNDFCIGLFGDSCMEFVYGSGFDYVGSGGPINIEPVIVLIRVNSPLGAKFGSGIFNFVGK